MKKSALIFILFICSLMVNADVSIYSENKKFGIKDSGENIIVQAKYKKLVRLGNSSWIVQDGNRFGIINDEGNILVKPIYNQAERVLGKYVKLRKGSKYCLKNEYGDDVLPMGELYSSIDLLPGGLLVTSKNYKYGIQSFDGKTQLDNIFDDIYMPDSETLVIVSGNKTVELKRLDKNHSETPFNLTLEDITNSNLKLSDIATSPLATTGYYGVTLTDYIIKLLSSISPAYEQTIDELMFSQGADTVSVLIKCTWIPIFPFVYMKNYYNDLRNPSNGPLNKAKKSLRKQIKN